MSRDDTTLIIKELFSAQFGNTIDEVIRCHQKNLDQQARSFNCRRFNLRDVEKVADLMNVFGEVQIALSIVYEECKQTTNEDRRNGSELGRLGEILRLKDLPLSSAHCGELIHSTDILQPYKPTQRLLSLLYASIAAKKICLLTGPPVSGKTSSVFELARCLNKKLYYISMHAETTITDLIGGIVPVSLKESVSERRSACILATEMTAKYPTNAIKMVADKARFSVPANQEKINKSGAQKKKLEKLKKLINTSESRVHLCKNDGFSFVDGPLLRALNLFLPEPKIYHVRSCRLGKQCFP